MKSTKNKSQKRKKEKPGVEIHNISELGICIYAKDREYFLSYEIFPWFLKATVKEIYNLEFLHGHHLYWPDLDIDLSIESLTATDEVPARTPANRR